MANPRVENLLTIAALVLLVGGCFLVLAPFISALLWAVVVTFSTWGVYERLLAALRGRSTLAALVMTLALAAVLVAPVVVVTAKLGENADNLARALTRALDKGLPPPPAWVTELPLVGDYVQQYWPPRTAALPATPEKPSASVAALPEGQSEAPASTAKDQELQPWLEQQAAPITKWLIARGLAFGQALLQISLSVLTAFYLYRDGITVAARFRSGMVRVAGKRAHALIDLASRTIKGVVYGVLGTALAQGTVATLGFWLAGVPGPFLLGVLTSAVSIIPMGPPFIWLPATLWLLHEGATGWAVFMFAWGLLLVSGIDNVVRPYLISHGAALPFLLVMLGVIGGLFAFGFIGLFLGPTLLAVGYAVFREWTWSAAVEAAAAPAGEPPAPPG